MARRTLEQIEASRPDFDRAAFDATTEEDIRRHMIEDGHDPDEDLPDSWELVVPPELVRKKLGMTQEEFAAALHVPIATLQDWERRGVFDPAVRSLLAIVYKMPEALEALGPKRAA